MSNIIEYNPLVPEICADPYPCYKSIRSKEPVHWNEQLKIWMVMCHRDIHALYRDSRLSSSRINAFIKNLPAQIQETMKPFTDSISLWMLFLDPPHHTRLRSLVNKAFTPRFIKNMQPQIEQVIDELLEEIAPKENFDFIQEFAYPLPVIIIAELLGMPREDRDQLKKWSDGLAEFLASPHKRAEAAQFGTECIVELNNYFRQIIALRRKEPKEDLISNLIAAEEQGKILNEEELLATCILLLFGGHETTTNLIGNGLLALLQHPCQLQKLKEDPGLINSAVEEMLRFDSPVQWHHRIAREELEISGVKIDKGQPIMMVIGSANRDPQVFSAPDTLDITRSDNNHLAFGYGIHFCVGAALARMEGKIAFTKVLQKLPDLELAQKQLEWQEAVGFRGLKSLFLRNKK